MKVKPAGFLFDLDGVFYTGGQAIPGGRETLQSLDAVPLPYRFITNTTTRPASALVEKLAGFGIQTTAEHILSAPVAAAHYLASLGKPRCRLVLDPSLREDFSMVTLDEEHPEYIVLGDIGTAWNYELMNTLFAQVMDGAKLIALHKGRFWKTQEGLRLDIGAFVAGLEYATGSEAVTMGKPSEVFFKMAVESLGLPLEQVAVVGDDIDSDIGGAQAAGLQGVLVRTGKYREDYAARSPVEPDGLIDSIADLPQWLGR